MSERSNDLLEMLGKNFKFKTDFDNGIVFDYTDAHDGKHRLKSVSPQRKPGQPREATLDISNLLFSAGASHHYGKFKLGWPSYVHASNGKPFTSFIGSDRNVPLFARHIQFELMRQVDKRDLAHDKEQARMMPNFYYGRMRRGEWTHGFWSEDEVKAAAIKFFKEHFEPGWILVPDSWEENVRPVFATT